MYKKKALYVLFDGTNPGIYMTFEEIIKENLEARKKKEDMTWKKYMDINEALSQARSIIGKNYTYKQKQNNISKRVKE